MLNTNFKRDLFFFSKFSALYREVYVSRNVSSSNWVGSRVRIVPLEGMNERPLSQRGDPRDSPAHVQKVIKIEEF